MPGTVRTPANSSLESRGDGGTGLPEQEEQELGLRKAHGRPRLLSWTITGHGWSLATPPQSSTGDEEAAQNPPHLLGEVGAVSQLITPNKRENDGFVIVHEPQGTTQKRANTTQDRRTEMRKLPAEVTGLRNREGGKPGRRVATDEHRIREPQAEVQVGHNRSNTSSVG